MRRHGCRPAGEMDDPRAEAIPGLGSPGAWMSALNALSLRRASSGPASVAPSLRIGAAAGEFLFRRNAQSSGRHRQLRSHPLGGPGPGGGRPVQAVEAHACESVFRSRLEVQKERPEADPMKDRVGWIVLKKSVEPNSTGQIIRYAGRQFYAFAIGGNGIAENHAQNERSGPFQHNRWIADIDLLRRPARWRPGRARGAAARSRRLTWRRCCWSA